MSLKFLLDEHLRGMLWKAVRDHNLAAATQSGRTSPGVLILKNTTTVRAIIDHLELVTEAGTEDEFKDCIDWIP